MDTDDLDEFVAKFKDLSPDQIVELLKPFFNQRNDIDYSEIFVVTPITDEEASKMVNLDKEIT